MANKKQTPKTEQPATDDMMTTTETTSEQKPMLQLGGLWVNESKKGNKYMSGYLGNLSLKIFRNTFKKNDNEPDYVMYLAEKPYNTDSNDTKNEDDIPF